MECILKVNGTQASRVLHFPLVTGGGIIRKWSGTLVGQFELKPLKDTNLGRLEITAGLGERSVSYF